MPVEVEAKFRVDPAAARARLAANHVALAGPEQQDDTFWDWPDGRLRKVGQALRIRRTVLGCEVTWKGPRQATAPELAGHASRAEPASSAEGGAKARSELNVPCGADPAPLLAALGLVPGLHVAKRRWSGALDGVAVTLDDVAGLGWFVEVECVTRDDRPESVAEARRVVAETARRLGLVDEEPRAYAELMSAAT